MLIYPTARTEDIVVQEAESELLIYDLEINKAFVFNETSAIIWTLCNGENTVPEISAELSKRSGQIVSEDLVWLALDQFNKNGLLVNGERVGDHFAGISRREMVRRVGIASLVVLPAVSSVVAPPAAAAQSVCLAPAPGTCIPAGQNPCPGCVNFPVNFEQYSSVDGSCTGTVFPPDTFGCSGISFVADIRIL